MLMGHVMGVCPPGAPHGTVIGWACPSLARYAWMCMCAFSVSCGHNTAQWSVLWVSAPLPVSSVV